MDTIRTKRRISFLPLILLIWLINSCASSEFMQRDSLRKIPEPPSSGPLPLSEPRILYTGSIKDPHERVTDGSWFKNVIRGGYSDQRRKFPLC